MKNKFSFSSKNDGSDSQFKSLNNNEMGSIRGGKLVPIPPLPPDGGVDMPLSTSQSMPLLLITVNTTTTATV